ncbi:MAG: hypothetical protein JW715_17165 [Sedimentisphaerales bacterium]|nr:hypothetical protein [Sedimentisphaerales bacterium]
MNKLQKRAWYELAGVVAAVIIAAIGLTVLVHINAKGITGLVAFTVAFLIAGLVAFIGNIRIYAQFDEREKNIYNKAFALAAGAFIFCTCFISFCIFFIAGAKSLIPVYVPPAIFLFGLFTAQFVQSAAILIQFAWEQADEQ